MKLRKLAALAMTAVLSVTALAGCGSDDNENGNSDGKKTASSIGEAFEMAAAMEKYTLSGSFTISAAGDIIDISDYDDDNVDGLVDALGGTDGITVGGTWEGKIDTKNNAADVSFGISLGGKSATNIFDYVFVDGEAYVGLGTMAEGIEKLLSDITGEENDLETYFDVELPEGNYLKISEETLNEIISIVDDVYGYALEDAGIPSSSDSIDDMFSDFAGSDDYEEIREAVDYFADLIIKGMKNGSDTCFTNDGNTYKMTINTNNLNDIISGIADQVKDNSDEIAEKINSIVGDEVVSSSELEQMAALISVYDVTAFIGDCDFSLSVTASYVDDTFNSGIAFAFSDGSDRIAVSFENTVKKDDSIKISAPEDVISDEDAEPIIDGLMDLLREGLDSSYEKLPFDSEYSDFFNDDEYSSIMNNDDEYSDLFNDDDDEYGDLFNDDDDEYGDLFNEDDDEYGDLFNDDNDDSDIKSEISSDKQYGSLKEYVESDELQSQLASQMEQYEGSGMSMDISADGNKLIYTYKYTDEKLIDEEFTLEDAQAYFDEAIESQISTFTSLCEQLPIYIDVKEPVVVLRYIDYDDTLIWEREITAED